MLRSEAVKLITEIAIAIPEVLASATQISLDCADKPNCRIFINNEISEAERELLLALFREKRIILSKNSNSSWMIR